MFARGEVTNFQSQDFMNKMRAYPASSAKNIPLMIQPAEVPQMETCWVKATTRRIKLPRIIARPVFRLTSSETSGEIIDPPAAQMIKPKPNRAAPNILANDTAYQ